MYDRSRLEIGKSDSRFDRAPIGLYIGQCNSDVPSLRVASRTCDGREVSVMFYRVETGEVCGVNDGHSSLVRPCLRKRMRVNEGSHCERAPNLARNGGSAIFRDTGTGDAEEKFEVISSRCIRIIPSHGNEPTTNGKRYLKAGH
jgi:hypothetical protein